jgi:hypothetical protein
MTMATRVSVRTFPPLKKAGPMRRAGNLPDAMEGKPAMTGKGAKKNDDGMSDCLRTVRR